MLLMFFLASCLSISAQNNLNIICKQNGNIIELRWAPNNLNAWRYGNNFGYKLERITIFRNGKQLIPVETVVLANPLTLKPLSEWEKNADDKYFSIAAECIFGEKNSVSGSSPVSIYKSYQQEQNKFGFALYSADMNKDVAEYMGLYFADKTVKKNEKYSYRLTFASPDSLYCDTARTLGELTDFWVKPQPEKPDVFFEKNSVQVIWKNSYDNKFVGYFVERSFDNNNFVRLNEEPIAVTKSSRKNNYYNDTTLTGSETVYYRIVGIDSFSDESTPSETSGVLNSLPITKFAEITSATSTPEGVKIDWKFDDETEIAHVTGYKVYRASSHDRVSDCLTTITDIKQKSFVDKHSLTDNYYFISVFNNSEEKYNPYPVYCQTIDSIPPVVPNAPQGRCDSLGRVYLTWQNPNPTDIAGFRLLRKNSEGENYVMLVPYMLTDTFYVDTINLNTLSRNIYYSLKSVDSRGNQSELSSDLRVQRYDKIAPQPSMISNLELNKNGVLVSWNKSVSKDVESYLLLRKLSKSLNFDTLKIISSEEKLSYLDKTAEPGLEYNYQIVTKDGFGNCSVSKQKTLEVPNLKETEWQLKNTKTLSSITLKWSNKSDTKQVDKVLIYRKIDDTPLHYYTVVKNANEFVDKNLVIGKKYSYRIRVVYTDATETQQSNEVKAEM